ncbi:F-box protein CPR1-like [Spinacia oleracea]|uniref:F-box protein CPR1-like n=1 Tax=Spinacia oleracea TaxID=3562 RepID=A0ABM3RDY4_SPIOL|nr:F-box protein CPR1-like [Spinacia oleracea]XP_056693806.1 F-box protein CPR1-like [Spinacia oleracea]
MAEFPPEIITLILSKLPAKSLVRFKSVCKPWNSLIKSSNFVKIHLNRTLTSDCNRHLLVSVGHLSLHSSKIDHNQLSFSEIHDPIKPRQLFNLVGSRNGVVCISNISKTDVLLFNPVTKSRRKLPSPQIPIPKLNITVFGFGYDSKNDDYKVLRIVQGLGKIEDSNNKAQVYSLNSNSWRCVQGLPYSLYYGIYDGVLFNEALHYVVTHESESMFIATFDLRTEGFSRIDYPNYKDKFHSESVFTLTELGGCLCLFINCHKYKCDADPDEMVESESDDDEDDDLDEYLDARVLEQFDFWVMKEYGNKESWVKLFSICKPWIIGSSKFIRPVVYSKDGRRILLEIDNSRYCWYDLESGNVERITVSGLPKGNCLTGTSMDSLVSLEDKILSEKETLPRKNKKKVVDNFLSTGFKLRL